MQLRFLAAAGPAAALDDLGSALARSREHLAVIGAMPELRVWTPPDVPWIMSDDNTAVAIGLVFERDSGARLPRLPAPVPGPQEFAKRYWGIYVLLASDAQGRTVFRDPSGGVAAYYRAGPLGMIASDAALLAASSSARLAPSSTFLRHWLAYPFHRTALSGIEGVTELLPGEALFITPHAARRELAWAPSEHAPEGAPQAFDTAAERVRETVLMAVSRLTDGTGNLIVELSGGLDSSIVAAALAAADRPFRAVTFATLAPDGDERSYARDVARQCGASLDVLRQSPEAPEISSIPPVSARPPPNPMLRSLQRAFSNHLALAGADLTVSGTGGDNVFGYASSAAPVVDALRRGGPRTALMAAHDLARLHGTTLRVVLRAAWRRGRRPRPAWPRDENFLAPGTIPAEPRPHPWLEISPRGAAGTYELVRSLVGIRHFVADPTPNGLAEIHPLLSQPVLEACLKVPSWLWVCGGRDRAVARAAFAHLLPRSVLTRRTKGGLQSLFLTGYMATRGEVESLLLDGRLAQMGLLDVAAIRAYLATEGQPRDLRYIRLLDLVSAETWLRGFDA